MEKVIFLLGICFICTFVVGFTMLFNGVVKQIKELKDVGGFIALLSLMAIIICELIM